MRFFHTNTHETDFRRRGATLLATMAVMLTVACGGGSGGGILSRGTPAPNETASPNASPATTAVSTARPSTPQSGTDDKAAVAVAQKLYVDLFSMLAGTQTVSNVLDNFTQSCIPQTPLAALLTAIDNFQADHPSFKGTKIQDLDFGSNVKVERSGSDVTVRIPGTREAQVKVEGKFVNAHQFFVQKGVEKDSEGGSGSNLKLTAANGRLYVSDCSILKGFADYKPTSATPVSTRTPIACCAGPTPAPTTRR